MKALHITTMTLLWVGGINWGLVGLFNFNLVDTIFGGFGLTNIVYILVGLAAVYGIYAHMMTDECRVCKPK